MNPKNNNYAIKIQEIKQKVVSGTYGMSYNCSAANKHPNKQLLSLEQLTKPHDGIDFLSRL